METSISRAEALVASQGINDLIAEASDPGDSLRHFLQEHLATASCILGRFSLSATQSARVTLDEVETSLASFRQLAQLSRVRINPDLSELVKRKLQPAQQLLLQIHGDLMHRDQEISLSA